MSSNMAEWNEKRSREIMIDIDRLIDAAKKVVFEDSYSNGVAMIEKGDDWVSCKTWHDFARECNLDILDFEVSE
jgi:hypothetical protein